MELPYHFSRSRPGALYADYMVSSNLGRTIQSMRQAVWDGQQVVGWLESQGYEQISVMGFSFGTWVAALVASFDIRVTKLSLFLAGGNFADFVWSGRATQAIKRSIESEIDQNMLRRIWSCLDLELQAERLSRNSLRTHVILAKRDKVIIPAVSESFVSKLGMAQPRLAVIRMNCGHYSLALPQYGLRAAMSLRRFLGEAEPSHGTAI
jgi:pimeloyl-ACP methyl ester carboxylesterase